MSPLIISFLSARSALNTSHERYPGSQLGPGSLAAHGRFSLMLLHSCPDMVQRVPLRETKTSAPLTRGSFTRKYPRQNITPAVADCRYRAPLSPRLCGPVKYTWMATICQVSKTCPHHVISMIPTSFYQVWALENSLVEALIFIKFPDPFLTLNCMY